MSRFINQTNSNNLDTATAVLATIATFLSSVKDVDAYQDLLSEIAAKKTEADTYCENLRKSSQDLLSNAQQESEAKLQAACAQAGEMLGEAGEKAKKLLADANTKVAQLLEEANTEVASKLQAAELELASAKAASEQAQLLKAQAEQALTQALTEANEKKEQARALLAKAVALQQDFGGAGR
jgi:vacuolar-type H+-ATPase subunit H